MILLAQAGLYLAASFERDAGIWIFLALQGAGMLLALWGT